MVDSSIADAERGDFSTLDETGEQGGEGAWYVLAAAAYDAGNDVAAGYARIRSAREDVYPFNVKSLSMLLLEDPDALRRPLSELKKAVRLYGEDEDLKAARIAVLSHNGRDQELRDEYEHFEGLPAEAPVLAAMLTENPDDPTIRAVAERYILHCPDPGVLKWLPSVPVSALEDGIPHLAGARLAFARGAYVEALTGYRRWIESSLASGTSCNLESPSPVFAEIAEAASYVEEEESWADYLSFSALRFDGAKQYAAAFQAGKIRRELKDYAGAAADFSQAAAALGIGLDRDRALWYRLRVSYETSFLSTEDEMEIWQATWSEWENPDRFDDQLEIFIHRRVRNGEWNLLEQIVTDRAGQWPGVVRAQAYLVMAFATSEGRVSGNIATGDYLEEVLEADPVSWPGFRAAGLLNRDIVILDEPFSGMESFEDRVLSLYLSWGLDSLAYRLVMDSPSDFSADSLRLLAAALADQTPRLSIRIAGLLWRIDGYHPDRSDLLLRHPLPFGDMAAEYAESEGVPPELFHGLIRTESAWDTYALSRSGAMGLAQFMPATWEEWLRRMRYPADSDPTDPEINAALGAAYLDWLYEREWTWSWIDSLASYNAGGGRVRTWRRERPGLGDDLFGESLPVEEPRSYIRKVLSAATMYGYLYSGESPGSLHEKWGLEMIEVN